MALGSRVDSCRRYSSIIPDLFYPIDLCLPIRRLILRSFYHLNLRKHARIFTLLVAVVADTLLDHHCPDNLLPLQLCQRPYRLWDRHLASWLHQLCSFCVHWSRDTSSGTGLHSAQPNHADRQRIVDHTDEFDWLCLVQSRCKDMWNLPTVWAVC